MKYNLKGNFLNIVNQIQFLKNNSIEVNLNDGIIYIEGKEQYIKALNLLILNKIDGYEIYEEPLNKLKEEKYVESIYRGLYEEEYTVTESNGYVLATKNKNKYLYLTIPDNIYNIPFYSIVAKDEFIDLPYMETREIPFYINEESPLYSTVNSMYKGIKEYSENMPNSRIIEGFKKFNNCDNHIRIDQVDNGYNFVVVKDLIHDNEGSVQTIQVDIGTPYQNDKWFFIDSLYNKLQDIINNIKSRVKEIVRKIR